MEIEGRKDSVIIKSGSKSLLNSLIGASILIVPVSGNKTGANLSGLMTPYTLVQGSGSWTVNLLGTLKGGSSKSAFKSSALFHYIRCSSNDILCSDSFLCSNDSGKE